jgi:hypothetical protein
MQSMKFDLDFEEKLISSTHRSSRKYSLGKKWCFESIDRQERRIQKEFGAR